MLRDNDEKVIRGYTDKNSIVWPDGREKLVGADWNKRKDELYKRCEGRCENVKSYGRCRYRFARKEMHPHHKVRRSVLRDDRLEALVGVCYLCHYDLHPEKKTRFGESKVFSEGLGDA